MFDCISNAPALPGAGNRFSTRKQRMHRGSWANRSREEPESPSRDQGGSRDRAGAQFGVNVTPGHRAAAIPGLWMKLFLPPPSSACGSLIKQKPFPCPLGCRQQSCDVPQLRSSGQRQVLLQSQALGGLHPLRATRCLLWVYAVRCLWPRVSPLQGGSWGGSGWTGARDQRGLLCPSSVCKT